MAQISTSKSDFVLLSGHILFTEVELNATETILDDYKSLHRLRVLTTVFLLDY